MLYSCLMDIDSMGSSAYSECKLRLCGCLAFLCGGQCDSEMELELGLIVLMVMIKEQQENHCLLPIFSKLISFILKSLHFYTTLAAVLWFSEIILALQDLVRLCYVKIPHLQCTAHHHECC